MLQPIVLTPQSLLSVLQPIVLTPQSLLYVAIDCADTPITPICCNRLQTVGVLCALTVLFTVLGQPCSTLPHLYRKRGN